MKYDINFRHLEYFIKVARLGSINKAAQALYISQPYLGKIMHDLEENLGARLFNRSRSGVTLTPEGMEFLTHSEKIIDEMEQLWFQKKKEQIKISDPLAVSMTRFSHIMESFSEIILRHRDQPSFSHRLYEGNSDEVIEDVVSGRVDVGVFHFDSRKRLCDLGDVRSAIEFQVEISENKTGLKPIKVEDRLRYLTEKNPLVAKLRRDLDLDIE